jgi:hypothetical protein
VCGMVCVRCINLVVVDCDSNFMSYHGVYQFRCYLTRETKNTCAIVLSESRESLLTFIDFDPS